MLIWLAIRLQMLHSDVYETL